MSKQENFHRPEKPLGKMQEIDNEARIESRNEKKIQQKSEAPNSVRHPAKLSNILGPMKDSRSWSHMSTRTTGRNYLKKLLAVRPKNQAIK